MGQRPGSGRPKVCNGYIQWVEELLSKRWSIRKVSDETGISRSVVGRIAKAKKNGGHY